VSDTPVGADIETLRPIRRGAAERVCTEDELRAFDFLELWTLKESWIKLVGRPLPMRELVFARDGDEIIPPISSTDGRAKCRLLRGDGGDGYVCAAITRK
jgi:hypothetical protein